MEDKMYKKYVLKSGQTIEADDVKELADMLFRTVARTEMRELTQYPLDEKDSDGVVDDYREIIEEDPVIRRKKGIIGQNLMEGYWLGKIRFWDGMREFFSFIDDGVVEFWSSGKQMIPHLLLDAIALETIGDKSAVGEDSVSVKDMKEFLKAQDYGSTIVLDDTPKYLTFTGVWMNDKHRVVFHVC